MKLFKTLFDKMAPAVRERVNARAAAILNKPEPEPMHLHDLDIHAIGDTIQLTGVIYASADTAYLCYFPKEDDDLPTQVLKMNEDDWKAFIRQTDLLEVEILEKAEDGTITKAILRKSQRQIDQVVSWNVFRRDGYRCRYCGRNNVPLTVDHLVTWEEGGPTVEDNLVSACKKCNKTRGRTEYAAWLASKDYRKVSERLTPADHAANQALVPTLDAIPRVTHIRSR